MEAPMERRWTDDRLDDFQRNVDVRFDRIEGRLERIETRLDGMQQSIVDLNKSVADLSVSTANSIAGLHKTMSQFAMMLVVALVGLTATQLGLILTQL
jgi:hypothetical protein